EPVLEGSAASVWGRTYLHGRDGLLNDVVAAEQSLLESPVRFVLKSADGEYVARAAGDPKLARVSKGKISYRQSFTAGGMAFDVAGELDYDGFYRFQVKFGPQAGRLDVQELY